MKYSKSILLGVISIAIIAGILFYRRLNFGILNPFPDTYTTEKSEYIPPEPVISLKDDSLSPGDVPAFDPDLNYPRQVGGWEINLSQAVFKLDTPVIKPDQQQSLLKVYPDYSQALNSHLGYTILPSVNLVQGKAKQFDDGLYAALEKAYYEGVRGTFPGHVDFFHRLAESLPDQHPANPLLSAGLSLAGVEIKTHDETVRQRFLWEFERNKLASVPLGFYEWAPELRSCYRFLKFFQTQSEDLVSERGTPGTLRMLSEHLKSQSGLLAEYRQIVDFYAHLTNPPLMYSLADVPPIDTDWIPLSQQRAKRGLRTELVIIPSSTMVEQRLFDRLFATGLPPGTNLMSVLINNIVEGQIDLTPTDESGWYDHQIFALETFLLPRNGQESVKLCLTANYKRRMIDAFSASITKIRETHIRQGGMAAPGCAAPERRPDPLLSYAPHLRIEPQATYFLRMARAYGFIRKYLIETVGSESLAKLHGLRANGQRELDLNRELEWQQHFLYGLYLIAMEDIGLRPKLLEGELPELEKAYQIAENWLANYAKDLDLTVDTRVIVPILTETLGPRGDVTHTHVWATTGVRLAPLNVEFDRSVVSHDPGRELVPYHRVAGSSEEWKPIERSNLKSTAYVIPVDEFVTARLKGANCPTRTAFRELCDQSPSRELIIQRLESLAPQSSRP